MNELQWDDENMSAIYENVEDEYAALYRYYIKVIEGTQQLLSGTSIKIKLDAHTLDSHSLAPLHHATINGKIECVELLLKYGCPANIETSDGFTALHLSSTDNNILELLLKNGANPNKVSYTKQETPLMMAAKKGDLEWMKLLLNHNANINALNWRNQSALTCAVINNQLNACKLLIQHKCRINEIDSDGFSPISYALRGKNKDVLNLLIISGGRLHPIQNCLQNYLRMGSTEIIKILIEAAGVNPNLRSNEMWSPLHVAIKYSDYEIIEYLINTANARLGQPLYRDCKEIHLLMTRKYDKRNFTRIFNLLLENSIDFDDLSEHHKKTPLEISIISNNFHITTNLIKQGCNVNRIALAEYDFLQQNRNSFSQLINLINLAGYKFHRPKSAMSLKEVARINVRKCIVNQIKYDQKYTRLKTIVFDPHRCNTYIENYVQELHLPISLKEYLCHFPDVNCDLESNLWPKNPISTFEYDVRLT